MLGVPGAWPLPRLLHQGCPTHLSTERNYADMWKTPQLPLDSLNADTCHVAKRMPCCFIASCVCFCGSSRDLRTQMQCNIPIARACSALSSVSRARQITSPSPWCKRGTRTWRRASRAAKPPFPAEKGVERGGFHKDSGVGNQTLL